MLDVCPRKPNLPKQATSALLRRCNHGCVLRVLIHVVDAVAGANHPTKGSSSSPASPSSERPTRIGRMPLPCSIQQHAGNCHVGLTAERRCAIVAALHFHSREPEALDEVAVAAPAESPS